MATKIAIVYYNGELDPDEVAKTAAKLQGKRVAQLTGQFLAGKNR